MANVIHARRRVLFIVDPNNDFGAEQGCDPGGYVGTLLVKGAWADSLRLHKMIMENRRKIDEIMVSSDCHAPLGVERPGLLIRDSDGADVAPFTFLGIHPDRKRVVKLMLDPQGNFDPTEESYSTKVPAMMHRGGVTGKGFFGYLDALAQRNRYPHMVWPRHCVIGSRGQTFLAPIDDALTAWSMDNLAVPRIIAKGSNPGTENFSAVVAEVPDPRDPTTQLNTDVISTLEEYDEIGVAGWALSHCLANTFRDIIANFRDPATVRKIRLLTDATSSVAGLEFLGDAFVKEILSKGAETRTTENWLA
jgi:nicotinamidase-related amidase